LAAESNSVPASGLVAAYDAYVEVPPGAAGAGRLCGQLHARRHPSVGSVMAG
jgi:hypothetical protein